MIIKKRPWKAASLTAIVVAVIAILIFSGISANADDSGRDEDRYVVTVNETEHGIPLLDGGGMEGEYEEGEEVSLVTGAEEGWYFNLAEVMDEDGNPVQYSWTYDGIHFTMPGKNVTVRLIYESYYEESDVSGNGGTEDALSDTNAEHVIIAYDVGYTGPAIVGWDMSCSEIMDFLPEEISVVLDDGGMESVLVSWTCSLEADYNDNPESYTSLSFVAQLPDGWVLDPSDEEIKFPTVIIQIADPYGIQLLSTISATLVKGSNLYYGGWNTHKYTYGGEEAYCANPSASSPDTGTYSATSITREDVAACVWYGYGGPGFCSEMWPSTWYDGTAMTADRYRVLTHIVLSDVYSHDGYYAYGQCSSSFIEWCEYNVVGYDIVDGSVVNSNAIRVNLARNGFAAIGGSGTWPAGFVVYEINTGSTSQTMLSHTYDGSETPAFHTVSYTARRALSPSLDLYIRKTDSETGEVLSGAVFDVYMDGTKVSTVTTDLSGAAVYHWRGSTVYTSYFSSSILEYCLNYDELNSENKAKIDKDPSIYKTRELAYADARKEAVTKADDALKKLKINTAHTWKVIEVSAPKGYQVNDTVWEQSVSAEVTAVEVAYADEPAYGFVDLKKKPPVIRQLQIITLCIHWKEQSMEYMNPGMML